MPESYMELKRTPGTCCPEPTCDTRPDCLICESCRTVCSSCERNKFIIFHKENVTSNQLVELCKKQGVLC